MSIVVDFPALGLPANSTTIGSLALELFKPRSTLLARSPSWCKSSSRGLVAIPHFVNELRRCRQLVYPLTIHKVAIRTLLLIDQKAVGLELMGWNASHDFSQDRIFAPPAAIVRVIPPTSRKIPSGNSVPLSANSSASVKNSVCS